MANILKFTVARSANVSHREVSDNIETLTGIASSDERGALIGNAVLLIIKNRAVIAEQQTAKTPNAKIIAKAQENIKDCIETVKTHLVRMDASDAVVATVVDYINQGDMTNATLAVLKQMAHKNPGLHERKYKQALAKVAERQR